jgi:general stress protein YciG
MSAEYGHSHTHFNAHETKNQSPQRTTTSADERHVASHEEPHELIADRPPEKLPKTQKEEGPRDVTKSRRPRGFAAMDRKLVSEIARKGGKAAHSAGTAHEFTAEEARVAGRKGGRATHAKRRDATSGGREPTETSNEVRGETATESGDRH